MEAKIHACIHTYFKCISTHNSFQHDCFNVPGREKVSRTPWRQGENETEDTLQMTPFSQIHCFVPRFLSWLSFPHLQLLTLDWSLLVLADTYSHTVPYPLYSAGLFLPPSHALDFSPIFATYIHLLAPIFKPKTLYPYLTSPSPCKFKLHQFYLFSHFSQSFSSACLSPCLPTQQHLRFSHHYTSEVRQQL